MPLSISRVGVPLAKAALAFTVVATAACVGHLSGRASDEWTHSYPLAAGGEVEIINTNGAVTLTLAPDAKADLSASVTNGGISVTGLKLETTEQSRRRLEGKINGGGPSVELHTTNGGVRVRVKGSAGSDAGLDDRGDG